jgi:2-keto-4-pentenoate hydratase
MTSSANGPEQTASLSQEAIERLARMIWDAWQAHVTLPRPDAALWPNTVADGYAIQDALARISGLHSIGWKIGATNQSAQEHLSLSGPLSGRLFAPFRHDSPAMIDSHTALLRALEPEIAFRMGRDLPKRARPYNAADVTEAIAWAQPALEIPDSRDAIVAKLVINGETVETGRGADVMGGPLNVVAWLANHLIDRNTHLKTGDLVSTGTCTRIRHAARGDDVVADFGDFGQASTHFD